MSKIKLLGLVIILSGQHLRSQNIIPESQPNQMFALGAELYQKRNFLASRKIFENFLLEYPKDPRKAEAHYYVAFNAIQLEQEDAEFLMTDFVASHEGHPLAANAWFDLGRFYYEQGEYDKAISNLSRVDLESFSYKTSMEGNFKLGYSYYEDHQNEKAHVHMQIVATAPNEYYDAALYYAGFINYEQGRFEEASKHFLRISPVSEFYTKTPELIASCYYRSGQYAQLNTYTGSLEPARLNQEVLILSAEGQYQTNNFSKASDLYAKALASGNSRISPLIYFHQGYANYKINNIDVAIDSFKKSALSIDTIGQYSQYYLGLLYTRNSNKQFALNAFEEAAREVFNENIAEESLFRIGQLHYELGEYAQAINQFNAFHKKYASSRFSDRANEMLSDAYLKTNNYDQAIIHIESMERKSESIQKVYQQVTYLKGTQLFNNSQFEASIRYFNKSLQTVIDPVFAAAANYWKGEAYSVGRKWVEAINAYSQIVFNRNPRNTEYFNRARYGLAYAYYNSRLYDRARTQFSEYLRTSVSSGDITLYRDALVRLGDCYFVEKNYGQAISNYERALSAGSINRDYLWFQTALAYGFQNNIELARQNFLLVINTHPNTRMAERAGYQLADLEFENGNFERAVNGFTDLINKYPGSDLVPFAFLKRGVSNFNLKKYDEATADYAAVMNQFITHEVANSALLGLQELSAIQGVTLDLDQFVAQYRQANPNDTSVERIEFESAKRRYFNQEYQAAIDKFSSFLTQYPNSGFRDEILYFIADSYNRSGRAEEALNYFYQVLEYPQVSYFNRSVQRIADLQYSQGNYEDAIRHYQQLGRIAKNQRETFNSRTGLMLSYYQQENLDSVKWYANQILASPQTSTDGQSSANLFLGKAALDQSQFEEAIRYFEKTRSIADDRNAAEATYLIGKAHHLTGNYQRSNEVLFTMNSKFSIYEIWLGRAFLLIARNYFEMEEIFQAKATLHSIIEKSPIPEIVQQAEIQLSEVEKKEREIIDTQKDTVGFDSNQPEN